MRIGSILQHMSFLFLLCPQDAAPLDVDDGSGIPVTSAEKSSSSSSCSSSSSSSSSSSTCPLTGQTGEECPLGLSSIFGSTGIGNGPKQTASKENQGEEVAAGKIISGLS